MILTKIIDIKLLLTDPEMLDIYAEIINTPKLYSELLIMIEKQTDQYNFCLEILQFKTNLRNTVLDVRTILRYIDFSVPGEDEKIKAYKLLLKVNTEDYDQYQQYVLEQEKLLNTFLELKKKVCEKWNF